MLAHDITHFVRLARRGYLPAASSGEVKAYELAQAILTNVPGLDNDAINGLVGFIAIAAVNWTEANEALGAAGQ